MEIILSCIIYEGTEIKAKYSTPTAITPFTTIDLTTAMMKLLFERRRIKEDLAEFVYKPTN